MDLLIRRIVANIIDIFVLIASVALGTYLAGQLLDMFEEPFFLLTISAVCVIILVPIGLQSLFWLESSTIGKTMVFIKVVRNDNGENLDYFQMMIRDFLIKILSANLTTLPAFFGRPATHDVVLDCHVIRKPRGEIVNRK